MICFELLSNYIRVVIIKIQNYIQNKPKLYMGWIWVNWWGCLVTLFNWLFFISFFFCSLIFFYYHRIWKLLNVACNNITNLLWNWKIVRKERKWREKKNVRKKKLLKGWRKFYYMFHKIIFFRVIECFFITFFLRKIF